MPYVCITGNEQSPSALEQRLESVLRASPRMLCELRLDYLDLNPAAAFAFLAKLPSEWAPRLILTQRLQASGAVARGQCTWDVNTWQSWWKDVMGLRPWFAVDLDWLILDRLAGESLGWRGRFRSRHAFFSLHAELDEIEAEIQELEASARSHNAGIKIACPVRKVEDLTRLAALKERLGEHPLKIVVAMGTVGKAWRWSRLVGDVSYFAYTKERSTALGQSSFEEVLPYLRDKRIPELYLLWSEDPSNSLGEKNWNRAFLARGWQARYVNVACDEPAAKQDLPHIKRWSECALSWMSAAGVKGASVTKPFKTFFPSVLHGRENGEDSVNTLYLSDDGRWSAANHDGPAVQELLQREGIDGGKVAVLGSGGAARAVLSTLTKAGYEARLFSRGEQGRLADIPEAAALVSSWPASAQGALVAELERQNLKPPLIIDAQLAFPKKESPLARYAEERGVRYVEGLRWWNLQAEEQDITWHGSDRLGDAKNKALSLLPRSKSETIRALAVAFAFPGSTEILNPSRCEDTEFFLKALEAFGADTETEEGVWRLRSPKHFALPLSPIPVGEGATGFRILMALSSLLPEGEICFKLAPSLLKRPQGAFFESFGARVDGEKVFLKSGMRLPEEVSVEESSQFASALLIAKAGRIFRGVSESEGLALRGKMVSEPYFRLTLKMLQEAGFGVQEDGNRIRLGAGQTAEDKLGFSIDPDASALSFLEIFARMHRLRSFFETGSRQGDSLFPDLLKAVDEGETRFSLRDTPDLAPPLWAYAVLKRKRLEIVDSAHLRLKESDRAAALVEASRALGLKAELRDDGFGCDAAPFTFSREARLETAGDHRLAMAFGILEHFCPGLSPSERDSVKKSFPHFFRCLQLLGEALP